MHPLEPIHLPIKLVPLTVNTVELNSEIQISGILSDFGVCDSIVSFAGIRVIGMSDM